MLTCSTTKLSVIVIDLHYLFSRNLTQYPGECGVGSLFLQVNETQNLTSPGFPSLYRNDLICRWIVTAIDAIEDIIWVKFITFDLERGYDFLQIGDGDDSSDESSLIGSFTGRLKLHVLSSNEFQLWIVIVTDSSGISQGFHIEVTSMGRCGMSN